MKLPTAKSVCALAVLAACSHAEPLERSCAELHPEDRQHIRSGIDWIAATAPQFSENIPQQLPCIRFVTRKKLVEMMIEKHIPRTDWDEEKNAWKREIETGLFAEAGLDPKTGDILLPIDFPLSGAGPKGRAVLIHELVHFLQVHAAPFEGDVPLEKRKALEEEAYALQSRYILEHFRLP